MSRATKPTSEKTTTKETALPEAELDRVSGGKVTVNDIKIVKQYDKSSPNLG